MSTTVSNNLLFSGLWKPPFRLAHEQTIDRGGRVFGPTRLLDGRLFVTRGGYLACLDPDSREMLWEIEPGQPGMISTFGDARAFFANIAFGITRLDMDSGKELWRGDEKETLHALSEDASLTSVRLEEHPEVRRRDKNSGEIVWTAAYRRGSVNGIADGGTVLVIDGGGGFDVVDAATGTTLWRLDGLEWCERNCPERAAVWKKQYASAVGDKRPLLTIGPVVDGTLFASIDVGLVIAFDLASGKAKWTSALAGPVDVAQTMIFRDDRLFFNRFQRMGTTSYLSSVNANDGVLVFRHEEDFTPGGCANPIMLDRLFLGGGAQHVAAFDVESRDFVWRYEYPRKRRAFDGRPCAIEGGFVATSSDARKLLWFEGEG